MSGNKIESGSGPAPQGYEPGAPLLERPGEPLRGAWVITRSGDRVAQVTPFDLMVRNFDVSRAMVTGELPARLGHDIGSVALPPNMENLTE